MRNRLFPSSSQPWEAPPDGDFARYVEELVALQARSLQAGQRVQQVTPAANPVKKPAQSQRASAAAEPAAGVARASGAPQAAPADTRHALHELLQEAEQRSATPPSRMPPGLIAMLVFAGAGLLMFFGGPSLMLLLALVWVFVVWRAIRAVVSRFKVGEGGTLLKKRK